MSRPRTLCFAVAFALGMLLLDRPAGADGEDWPAIRALVLFNLGRVDLAAQRYAEAIRKFADSQRLDPAAGTMLNLAFCYEQVGKVATAWADYRAAAVLAHQEGKPDWERDALERAAGLEPSLPHLVVHVQEPREGDWPEVLLDSTPLPKSLWGEPTPVDPGQHEVLAKAAGRREWTTTFKVDGEGTPPATVTVPPLDPAELPAPEPTQGAEGAPPVGRVASREAPVGPQWWTSRRTAAVVMGGAGVAAVGVGVGLGLLARSTYGSAECPAPGHCTAYGLDVQGRAFMESDIASVAGAVGGAALVGAAVLWMTSPSRPRGAHVEPAVGRVGWGISMRGDW